MKLVGGCHCGAVTFEVESKTPYPFMRCYCSICRKLGGSGGYAINLMADAGTMRIRGPDSKGVYNAKIGDMVSQADRHFCKKCGSHLWLWDGRWPDLIHPHAGAIDTPLPIPPEIVHIMLEFKPDWIEVPSGEGHVHFPGYPDQSIEEWHISKGLREEIEN